MNKIEIQKIFEEKNSKLAKLLPGLFYSWLEKIIHQDELNDFLKDHGDKQGIAFLNEAIKYFSITNEIKGIERIPINGRYLFVSNHPLGGFDGIILMKILADKFGDVRVIVNDILMNIPNLKPVFLPINKHGHQNKTAATTIDDAFKSDIPILTFPAGLCSRKIKGEITDLEWKKNFIVKSIEYKRDIVPVHFNGRNSSFFYNLSNLRKGLGIKVNIEMLYLVDEMFRHRNGFFKINFGDIISHESFDSSHNFNEWANEVRKIAYNLKS
jgi:1-acyl-sn-glycerol-3-phosphate acyltransferase